VPSRQTGQHNAATIALEVTADAYPLGMNAAKTGMRSVALLKRINHQRRREFGRRQQALSLGMHLDLYVVCDDPRVLNRLVPSHAKIAAQHRRGRIPSGHHRRSIPSGDDRPLRTGPFTLASKFHLQYDFLGDTMHRQIACHVRRVLTGPFDGFTPERHLWELFNIKEIWRSQILIPQVVVRVHAGSLDRNFHRRLFWIGFVETNLTREIGKSPWNLGKKVSNQETHIRMIFVDEVHITRGRGVSCQKSRKSD
jgi:hypothetical protein